VAPTSGPFCPNCGAQNPISAAYCGACGETLPRREDLASLWGQTPASSPARTAVTTLDRSLQDTQVIRPFSSSEQTWTVKPAAPKPSTESWEIRAPERVERGPTQPSGVLLGALALLLMCGVVAALGWFAGLPIVQDQLQTQVSEAVGRQVASLDSLSMNTNGEIVVTEKDLNESLGQHEKAYEPLKNMTVRIDDGLITITVDAYGTSSTYTADAKIDKGKLVIVDPKVDGPAGQVLSADELAEIIEGQFTALMNRFDRTPTAIRLRDGSISVATKSKTG
jgi:zinc-ribbon domain